METYKLRAQRPQSKATSVNDIRVLDLNIRNYDGLWSTRRELIVGLILDSEPDIVSLQEIRDQDRATDPRHQVEQILASLPGYTAVWRPTHYWETDSRGNAGAAECKGLAILSPHPIVDLAVARLSRAPDEPCDNFRRLVLGAQVRTAAGPFWLFNTHYPPSEPDREPFVVESLDFVTHTAGMLPFAFAGDFGAQPQGLPIRYLTGQVEIDGQCGNLADAWTARYSKEPSYPRSAVEPHQRIDYVFVPPAVAVQQIRVVSNVSGQEIISPSDHCGLLATLRVEAST